LKKSFLSAVLLFLPAIAFLVPLVLASGCWDRREISSLAVVLGTGIDLTPSGKIRLTVQVARPTAFVGGETGAGGKEAAAASWTVSAEGSTVEEAERNLARFVPRQIYWGHSIVLVMGEEMAKRGIRPVLNFFQRSRQPRENMWVMVSKGEAEKFLATYSVLEKTSSQAAGFMSLWGEGRAVHLREFSEMLAKRGVQPSCSLVEVKDEGKVPSPGEEKEQAAKKQAAICGTAVFKEDRLAGFLDGEETQAALWLMGEGFQGFVIPAPGPEDPSKMVSYKMRRGKAKITPYYDGETPEFCVSVEVEGDVLEQQGDEELAQRETLAAVEKSVSAEMEKKMAAVLQKAQKEYGSDLFGFGEAFRRRYKREWRVVKYSWDEHFARSRVFIQAEARVRDFGLLVAPAGSSKD